MRVAWHATLNTWTMQIEYDSKGAENHLAKLYFYIWSSQFPQRCLPVHNIPPWGIDFSLPTTFPLYMNQLLTKPLHSIDIDISPYQIYFVLILNCLDVQHRIIIEILLLYEQMSNQPPEVVLIFILQNESDTGYQYTDFVFLKALCILL